MNKKIVLVSLLTILPLAIISCGADPNPENIPSETKITSNVDYEITKFDDKIYCVKLLKGFTSDGVIAIFETAIKEIGNKETVLCSSFGNSQWSSEGSHHDDFAFVYVK